MFISSVALRKTSQATLAGAGIKPCIAASAGIKPRIAGRNQAEHHWPEPESNRASRPVPESSHASLAGAGIKPCIIGRKKKVVHHCPVPESSRASLASAGIQPSITGQCRNQAVPHWPESNRVSLAGVCAPLVVLSDLQARGCDPSRQGPPVPCVAARGDRALTDCLSLLGDRLAAASVMVAGLIAPETSPWQRAFSQTGC